MKEKTSKRLRLSALLVAAFLLSSTPIGVYAAESDPSGLSVSVRSGDGVVLDGAYLIDGTTYVPFRAYCDTFGIGGAVGWEDGSKTATYTADGLAIRASIGQPYLTANGRILYRDANNLLIDGRTYVPIRAISTAFSRNVEWYSDQNSRSVTLSDRSRAIEDASTYYDAESLLWLARVIRAEAEGEPFKGKIAVGNVVMNRIASELFPNTVYDVIFDTRYGTVQFYRPGDGRIMKDPTEECILAAKICLEGYSVSRDALYYLNPRTAKNFWIVNNRSYLFSIGLHDFYA